MAMIIRRTIPVGAIDKFIYPLPPEGGVVIRAVDEELPLVECVCGKLIESDTFLLSLICIGVCVSCGALGAARRGISESR